MQALRRTATAVLAAAALLAGACDPPPAQAGGGDPPAPTALDVKELRNGSSTSTVRLVWEGQGHDLYRIFWHEAGHPESRESKDARHGARYPEPPGVDATVGGLAHRTTYVFEVVHLGEDGEQSEPSNRLTVTTGPYDPPAVETDVDGNDVTLSWSRPPHHSGTIVYDIHDTTMETRLRTRDDEPQITISRAAAGAHEYTVHWDEWAEPSTSPVTVTIPASADTAPPTEPVVTFGPECPDFTTSAIRIDGQSTDDTTPQSAIRYEALRRDFFGHLYVYDYDFPLRATQDRERSHPGTPGENPMLIEVRAVDEAGNRNDPVGPEEVIPDC